MTGSGFEFFPRSKNHSLNKSNKCLNGKKAEEHEIFHGIRVKWYSIDGFKGVHGERRNNKIKQLVSILHETRRNEEGRVIID